MAAAPSGRGAGPKSGEQSAGPADEMVNRFRPDFTVVFANEAATRALGTTQEELMGRNWLPYVPEEERDRVRAAIEGLSPEHPQASVTHQVVLPTGEVRWHQWVNCALFDAEGRVAEYQSVGRDITELVQAEEALRESEARYRALFEQAADSVVLFDARTGAMVEFNDMANTNLGYTREEFARLTVPDYEVIESPEMFAQHCAKVLREGSDTFETKQRTKAGEVRDVHVRARRIVLHKRDYIIGIWRDVTDERRAAAALAASEERYRAITESAQDAIFCKDAERRYTFANPAVLRLAGLTAEQFLGKTPEEVFDAENSSIIREVDEASLRGETVNAISTLRIGGQDIVLHAVQVPLRNAAGQVVGITGVVRDVTEQHRLAEALRTSEETYRTIFNAAGDAIYVHDCETGDILEMNPAAYEERRRVGRPTDQASIEVVASEEAPCTADAALRLVRAAAQGQPQTFEWMERDRLGQPAWFLMHLTAATIRGQRRVLAFSHDITELRRAQEERLRIQKLESLGVLAGGIAHDFNNLLMGILTSITLARLDGSSSPAVVRTLEEAEKAVRRASGLTQQLLTFSRGGAPVRRPVALGDLFRETAEFALVGSNARVHFSIPDGLWPAEVDPAQISQVVLNLVINAAEAMPEGGVVAIAAANATLDAASGIPLPPGRYVKLVVRDTGVGIAPENLSRIFDPYFTTKGAGSGLGLAVVHSILRNHGGHVQVQSRIGVGSTFEAYLPAAEAPAQPAAPSPDAPRRARRVLVMDDDAIVRHGVERLLRRAGFGVATAADGDEAVELYGEAARRGERFDAVVLDLTVVNGMSGGACLERLRALDPDVRAVAASGFHRDAVLAEARERGFRAAVAKPFSLEQLISALNDATA